MALTVKMVSSGDVMLTYLHLTTGAAALPAAALSARRAGPVPGLTQSYGAHPDGRVSPVTSQPGSGATHQ
ncbi:hypothetical protein ACFYL6_19980 [Micromonospora sp. NPDC007208]|uniref:hypothetical protein n=1 Tax=Micromonospora sp. NPDC007208 TaxID=3364236 RepID=UPI0036C5D248